MNQLFAILFVLPFPIGVASAQPLLEISWEDNVDLINSNGHLALEGDVLKITNDSGLPLTVKLQTIDNPPITETRYAIEGEVRYANVLGQGHLESWNEFETGNFFSKTTQPSGPMGVITGTSNWRSFVIPFTITRKSTPPKRIELNLVLPGNGTVWLRPATLTHLGPGGLPTPEGQWWSNRTTGILGGVLGSLIGCLGALIGTLSSRGKARKLVMRLLNVMLAFGLLALCFGIIALIDSQPYAVYYPLLLFALLCGPLTLSIRKTVKARYEQIELRRMNSKDIEP